MTSPLAGEGIFREEFEKLKNRQENDKQLSELIPEVGKRSFLKRKFSFPSESPAPKKPWNSEDSYNRSSYRSGNSYQSGFKKPFRGSYSSGYKNNTSRSNSVSGFRPQGGNPTDHDSVLGRFPKIPVGGRLKFFVDQWKLLTDDQWVISTIRDGSKLKFLEIPPFSVIKETVVNAQNQNILLVP